MNANADPKLPADADWLDGLLAQDGRAFRDAYIADEGFTAAVMQALPAPVTLPAWRRPVAAALWGCAVAALAVAAPTALLDVAREAYRLLAAQPVSLSGIGAATLVFGAGFWGAAAYALRK